MRFIRSGYAEALTQLAEEGFVADAVLFDLGTSSMQLDTRERGFSYSYDAPLDMRMDPDSEPSARHPAGRDRRAPPGRDPARLRRGALRRRHRPRDRQAPGDRAPAQHPGARGDDLPGHPAPARFAGGHPAKRSFQAIRIAVNDELGQLDAGAPARRGSCCATGGVLAAISFHSLEDRRVKRFLAERARGCICPPDLPVCGCGREAEAALLNRRAIVAGAEELDANPRASSARLRAARKLQQGDAS